MKFKKNTFIVKQDAVKKISENIKTLGSLSGANDTSRFLFDKEHIFYFAQVGAGQNIDGIRCYREKCKDVLLSSDITTPLVFVSVNTKKLHQCFKHFAEKDLTFTLSFAEGKELAHEMVISDGDLEIPFYSGRASMVSDITFDVLRAEIMERESVSLVLLPEIFKKIKQLIRFTGAEEETIRVEMKDGFCKMVNKWTLKIGSCDQALNKSYYMRAKYLNQLEASDLSIELRMFDTEVGIDCGSDSYYMFPLDIV